MFTIDVQSRVPVWEQIVTEAEKYILLGVLHPDDRLPSVRELAMTAGVNPNTIAKAYSYLVNKGLVVAAGGRGYFVAKDIAPVLQKSAENSLPDFENHVKRLILSGISKERLKEIIDSIQ